MSFRAFATLTLHAFWMRERVLRDLLMVMRDTAKLLRIGPKLVDVRPQRRDVAQAEKGH